METTNATSPTDAISAQIENLRGQLQAQPEQPLLWTDLATLLQRAGRHREMLAAAEEAVRRPGAPLGALDLCGQGHLFAGRLAEAEAAYRRFFAAGGTGPGPRLNYVQVRLRQGHAAEALQTVRQVLARNPNLADAHLGLSLVQEEMGELEAALTAAREAKRLRPEEAQTHFRIAALLMKLLSVPEAQAAYREGLRLNPGAVGMHSSYLYSWLYMEAPLQEVFALHEEWARRHMAGIPRPASYPNGRDPERPLHVGLIAPTFSAHAGGIMGRGFIENFNSHEVHVTCYSDVTAPDHVTQLFRSRANRWHDITGWDDARVAAQVQADGIDILVDRSGHAGNNRLGVFARKPAPIQVSYLEYMNTTGMDAIDYWLSDPLATPLTLQPVYTERIWHLERTLGLYSTTPQNTAVTPLPALRNGFITFAMFNNPLKVQGRSIGLMARVLHALPTARVQFKYHTWDRSDVCERMRQAFAKEGIAPERLQFAGRSSRVGYLETFGQTDIGLDTFPNVGFTTTLESLWMGVPVVNLRGETTVSRIGYSYLTALGHPEWSVETEQQYVDLALSLAADVPKLATLRGVLRNEMSRSPLRDGPGYARSMERAFREMWRKWCREAP